MAEENKSQLISEAELIEAINADSIISVSLGAGQPQKNVTLSTLASVVAGVISPLKIIQAPSSIDDTATGLYYFNKSSTTGTFPNLTFNFGLILCLKASGVCNQFLFPTTYQGKIFHRIRYESQWKDWKEISQS